jgi:Flp pilus assembly protein TadD
LFPLKSHWLTEPLAQAVTAAVSNRLAAAGYAVTEARSDSPVLQLAVAEGWAAPESLSGDLELVREPLAVALGAEVSLLGEVVETDAKVSLRLRVIGTISRAEAAREITTPRLVDREAAAAGLAEQLVAALGPAVWEAVGAESEARHKAALARYAAGRTALAQGMYREAVLDSEAALLGDPRNPDFLRASAEARQGLGDYAGAAGRMRSLATVVPSDAEVALELGYAALRAGEATQAEAAFKQAAEQLGEDPRVVEGLALAMRAQGQPARAQEYYQVLVTLLPGLTGAPEWLPGLLADAKTTAAFAGRPTEEVERELSRLYLAEGKLAEGVQALLAYYASGERPPYPDDEYVQVAGALDSEATIVSREVEGVFARQAMGQLDTERADAELDALHARSEALATLAEKMQASPRLDPAHRYRVLGYNLLNEANFESLMFVRTGDAERQRRAQLLRTAFRRSLEQSQSLAAGLLGAQ